MQFVLQFFLTFLGLLRSCVVIKNMLVSKEVVRELKNKSLYVTLNKICNYLSLRSNFRPDNLDLTGGILAHCVECEGRSIWGRLAGDFAATHHDYPILRSTLRMCWCCSQMERSMDGCPYLSEAPVHPGGWGTAAQQTDLSTSLGYCALLCTVSV